MKRGEESAGEKGGEKGGTAGESASKGNQGGSEVKERGIQHSRGTTED